MKKNVKRLICVLMLGVMMVMLGACGAGMQTATCKIEQNGVVIELTMEANNDIITKWIQTSTISLGELDEAAKAVLDAVVEQSKTNYAPYDKVSYKVTTTNDMMVEVITIDMTDSDTIKGLVDAGLLPVTGNASKLSLKKTVKNLKSQGYTVEQ